MFESIDGFRPDPAHHRAAVPARPSGPTGCAELERVSALPPGAQTLVALDAIVLGPLNKHDRVTVLAEWERHRGWFDANVQRVLVAVGGDAPTDADADDWAREEVACALKLSTTTAGLRLDVARELCGRLARTGQALEEGTLTYLHARALADALADHDDAMAAHVEHAVLAGGHKDETLTNFRKRLDRAVIAANPTTADERHLAAVCGRRVVSWPEPDGMATIMATLAADEAATAMAALTALARGQRAEGDRRPIDVLRADAFGQVFAAALADRDLPTAQRARPSIGVTVDLPTLLHLADNPGHLNGYGPIPPVLARRLAAGGDWHRLVTDPVSGALLDYGQSVYRPPAQLAEYLIARDRTCRFPTCARPARLCDLDHAVRFEQGGATSSANGGALCRRNHRQKTDGNTQLISHPDGSATWTTSSGHRYFRPAVDHCPEHTAYLRALREAEPEPPDPWDPESPDHERQPENEDQPHRDAGPKAPARDDERTATTDPDPETNAGHDPPPF